MDCERSINFPLNIYGSLSHFYFIGLKLTQTNYVLLPNGRILAVDHDRMVFRTLKKTMVALNSSKWKNFNFICGTRGQVKFSGNYHAIHLVP